MSDEEYERKVRGTKTFCIIIGIIFLLASVFAFIQHQYISVLISIIAMFLLFLFYILTKKRNIVGPILGIIIGVLYILQFKLFTILIGVFVLIDSIAMLKYLSSK